MAGNKGSDKKFCVTVIPRDWPQFSTPTYTEGMSVAKANSAWAAYMRSLGKVGKNPAVYRGGM